jgi:hypothetical protein
VIRRPPTYRQDPLYWESFWDNLYPILKARFKALKFGVFEMVSFLLLIAINVELFSTGSPLIWEKQWEKVLFLLIISALLELLMQIARAVIPALWQTFRKERFRGQFKVLIGGTLAVTVWALYVGHYCYVHNSHFKITVVGQWFIANIPDYDGGIRSSYPTASVYFSALRLTNAYTPAKPHDWKLIATFPTGERLEGSPLNGKPILTDPGLPKYVVGNRLIWFVSRNEFDQWGGLGDGNSIIGSAKFVFPGVRTDTLLAPEAILTIEVEGLNDIAQTIAPNHLREERTEEFNSPGVH